MKVIILINKLLQNQAMRKTFLFLVPFVTVLMPLDAFAGGIAEYRRCIAEKIARMEQPRVVEAYRNQGCETNVTSLTGKKSGCHNTVCYNAPPDHFIVSVAVSDHSAAGTNNRIEGNSYTPAGTYPTTVCTGVSADSNSGPGGTRGWQKISADVTLQRRISNPDRSAIESECERIN